MKKIGIYKLVNPLTNEVFYVGKSACPCVRFRGHKRHNKSPVSTFIRKLLSMGVLAVMVEIKWCSHELSFKWEEYYIKKYKRLGHPLFNQVIPRYLK